MCEEHLSAEHQWWDCLLSTVNDVLPETWGAEGPPGTEHSLQNGAAVASWARAWYIAGLLIFLYLQ